MQNEIRKMCSLHVLTHCSSQSMACNCVPWPHVSVTRCSIGRSQRSYSSVLLHLLFRCTTQGIPIGSLHFREPEYNRVFLLDSLFAGYSELPASLQIQLAQIYGSSDGQLVVVAPSLSKQINGDDCSLYAIANMFEICQHGYDNVPEGELIWEFQPDDLRSHLISCFRAVEISAVFSAKR